LRVVFALEDNDGEIVPLDSVTEDDGYAYLGIYEDDPTWRDDDRIARIPEVTIPWSALTCPPVRTASPPATSGGPPRTTEQERLANLG